MYVDTHVKDDKKSKEKYYKINSAIKAVQLQHEPFKYIIESIVGESKLKKAS